MGGGSAPSNSSQSGPLGRYPPHSGGGSAKTVRFQAFNVRPASVSAGLFRKNAQTTVSLSQTGPKSAFRAFPPAYSVSAAVVAVSRGFFAGPGDGPGDLGGPPAPSRHRGGKGGRNGCRRGPPRDARSQPLPDPPQAWGGRCEASHPAGTAGLRRRPGPSSPPSPLLGRLRSGSERSGRAKERGVPERDGEVLPISSP